MRRPPRPLLLLALTAAMLAVPRGALALESPACPAWIAEDEFDDVPSRSVHERAVDCLAHWGVTVGNGGRYQPAEPVTRGQIASFLARLVERVGVALPGPEPLPFQDIDGTVHEVAIAQLGRVGVVTGVDGRYRPGAPLTRAGMAVFLVATFEHATGMRLPAGPSRFPDTTSHPQRDTIDRAAAAGLVNGLADGRFDPEGPVSRARMASFLRHLLDRLVEWDGGAAPEAPAWGELPPGRAPYLPLPTAAAGSYSFLVPDPVADTGARWNACEPIDVAVNPAGGPPFALAVVEDALGRLGDAMGTEIRLVGTTSERQAHESDPRGGAAVGILVNWPERWETEEIWGWGSYVAIGPTIVSATVALNPSTSARISETELLELVMHELGHAVGLGHVDDRDQIMYPLMQGRTVWGDGDRAGLARVGRGAGCTPPG